jgi:hypothetical protein
LTAADSDALETECPAIAAASPMVFTGGQVIYGNSNWAPKRIFGVGASYLQVRNWPMGQGAFFTQQEISASAKVCVIGHTLVEKLFQTTNPLGETIRIKRIPFRVVGVLETKGANMVGEDQDDVVLIPFTTVKKRLEGSTFADVHMIFVSAVAHQRMTEAQDQITRLLMERHRIKPGSGQDFHIENTDEISRIVGIVTGTMTLMLSARRARTGHLAAIPGRGGFAFLHWRRDRIWAGIGGIRRDHEVDQCALRRVAVAGGHLDSGGDRGFPLFRGRGHFLWLLPGPQSQPARSDRGAAI